MFVLQKRFLKALEAPFWRYEALSDFKWSWIQTCQYIWSLKQEIWDGCSECRYQGLIRFLLESCNLVVMWECARLLYTFGNKFFFGNFTYIPSIIISTSKRIPFPQLLEYPFKTRSALPTLPVSQCSDSSLVRISYSPHLTLPLFRMQEKPYESPDMDTPQPPTVG